MAKPHFIGAHDHQACVRDALAAARAVCAARSERFTPLRERVLELVWSSHRPIGAYAILEQLKGGRAAAPPTVYRALEFLMEAGLVHRIASLNAYVGCTHAGQSHAVSFLICRRCRAAVEIDSPAIGEALTRGAARAGFRVESQVVELAGLCKQCQADAA